MESLFSQREASIGGSWPVARYRVIKGVIHPDVELSDQVIKSDETTTWIAPLAKPDAFLSFARLAAHGEPSEDRILKWDRRYGLLYHLRPDSPSEVVLQEDAHGIKREVLNQKPMALEEFRKEARHAYLLLRLYETLRAYGRSPLRRQAVRENPDPGRDSAVQVSMRELSFDERHLSSMLGDGSRRYYLFSLGQYIEREIAGTKHTFGLPGGFAIKCPDVRTALYWQFACLVAGKRQTGICEGCGDIFVKTRKDKEVCNSSCRSRKSRKTFS
jgi:hypothetical protein